MLFFSGCNFKVFFKIICEIVISFSLFLQVIQISYNWIFLQVIQKPILSFWVFNMALYSSTDANTHYSQIEECGTLSDHFGIKRMAIVHLPWFFIFRKEWRTEVLLLLFNNKVLFVVNMAEIRINLRIWLILISCRGCSCWYIVVYTFRRHHLIYDFDFRFPSDILIQWGIHCFYLFSGGVRCLWIFDTWGLICWFILKNCHLLFLDGLVDVCYFVRFYGFYFEHIWGVRWWTIQQRSLGRAITLAIISLWRLYRSPLLLWRR